MLAGGGAGICATESFLTEEISKSNKVQVRIPADVARIMKQWGGRGVKLAAARGALPMSGPHLVTVLFVFCHGQDEELRKEALNTLRELSPGILTSAVTLEDVIPEILDLVARVRYRDPEVMEPLLTRRLIPLKTLLFLAERASGTVLDIIANNEQAMLKSPALKTLIINNPQADQALKLKLGWMPESKEKPELKLKENSEPEPESKSEESEEVQSVTVPAAEDDDAADFAQDDEFDDYEEDEEDELSKYQQLLKMGVSEKIKMATTGDKEWRTLLLRESNKLVTSAVLKNPRISDSEVVLVAKNRAASDDMIRIILLKKEWVKLYEIKKALAVHPRTPLQKAMRFVGFLTEKDLKEVARSKQIPQAIANTARRLVAAKDKNR